MNDELDRFTLINGMPLINRVPLINGMPLIKGVLSARRSRP
jgi:hypothetical protein